jgi:hypothetical protein
MYVQRFVNQFSRGLQSATLLPWFIPDSGSVREEEFAWDHASGFISCIRIRGSGLCVMSAVW